VFERIESGGVKTYMTIKFHLETFDKHQGWRTLETFAHLTDADAREHEIQESFVEQGLDVKTRVTKESKKFGITETEANELFQAPFNLAGQSQSSELTAEGLARAKAEADAIARKAQLELKPRITRNDIKTTGERIPYFGHMRKRK